jgi:hypothetical protein
VEYGAASGLLFLAFLSTERKKRGEWGAGVVDSSEKIVLYFLLSFFVFLL